MKHLREILFRGKRIEDGEWVYGWAFGDKAKSIIEIDKEYPNEYGVEAYYTSVVIPETVGQYTGLKDKSGKRIFEGDVVTASWYDYEEPREDTFGEVIFNEGWCSYCIWNEAENVMSEMNGQGAYEWEIEVIGNIHEGVQE